MKKIHVKFYGYETGMYVHILTKTVNVVCIINLISLNLSTKLQIILSFYLLVL